MDSKDDLKLDEWAVNSMTADWQMLYQGTEKQRQKLCEQRGWTELCGVNKHVLIYRTLWVDCQLVVVVLWRSAGLSSAFVRGATGRG